MRQGFWLIGGLFYLVGWMHLQANPPSKQQIADDARSFHDFRLRTLAHAIALDRQTPGKNDGAKYAALECGKLAHRTSPEYLYGIVTDLINDTSRTEEPYFFAIMVLDKYPPDAARSVVKAIAADPKYTACSDVQNWLWEMDEAQKGPH